MEAVAKSLRFLGEVKELVVPFFQRKYVWDENNWEELLQSFRNTDEMPFLGSIILKETSSKEETIIDGQQRLTTITILAKAIYDCLSAESKEPGSGIRNGIENYLFYRVNSADDFSESHIRIVHSRIDRNDYDYVISAQMLSENSIDLNVIDSSSSNVLRCYKYYYEKLKYVGDDELKNIFNSMFSDERKSFVLITLAQNDINEQTIFDTINRAGVRLSTADIIKNNIFKHLLDEANNEAQKEKVSAIYSDNWDKVFNENKSVSDLWDEKRVFGNVEHSNLEFLLYCFACVKWTPHSREDSKKKDLFSRLSEVYEEETSKLGFHELALLVGEIKKYAIVYKKYIIDFKLLLDDEQNQEHFKYTDGVRRLLLILQKFGVQMFYPYILKRIIEVEQDDNNTDLLNDLKVIESFVVRRRISPKGTNDYTLKCYDLILNGTKGLIKSDFLNPESGIQDIDIKEYLLKTKDNDAKVILFWIELYRRRFPTFDIQSLEYKYTLEHILPQKWESNWSDVPIIEDNETFEATSDEGKRIRNNYVQSLGNKTLLTGSLNSTVRNASYEKKINGISDNKPGYKSHTSLLLTKELVEAYENDPAWDESHIIERTEKLFSEFLEIWPTFTIRQTNTISEDDSTANYSPEQLADPLLLLNAIKVEDPENTSSLIKQDEIARYVSVQSDTIYKYIREGKIVPDKTVGDKKLFELDSIYAYAKQFGWEILDSNNIVDMFWRFIEKMSMSYSYKPLFIKSLFELKNPDGLVKLNDVVVYFLNYYKSRLTSGLCAEKNDSVFSKIDCSYEDAEKTIITYPVKRLLDMNFISYNKELELVAINPSILSSLSEEDIKTINALCDKSLEWYFEEL